jgi:hypothetical protein
MRNSLALLGIPDLPIRAFLHVGDRRIQPQGGGGGIPIVSDIVEAGEDLASSVSDAAADLDDTVNEEIPGGWATVVNVATAGQAAPYTSAAQAAVSLDKGASLEDVAKNYAISQAAGEVSSGVGASTGSQLAGNVAGSTAQGVLRGKSLEDSLESGLKGGAISSGISAGAKEISDADFERWSQEQAEKSYENAPSPTELDVMAADNTVALPPATTTTETGPGYYNERTGEFVSDPSGGLQNPLDNTSGTNLDSMKDYKYDIATNTWTSPDGEVVSLSDLSNTRTPLDTSSMAPTGTPSEAYDPVNAKPALKFAANTALQNAAADKAAADRAAAIKAAQANKTTESNNILGLLALLDTKAPQAPVQKEANNIKYFYDIMGSDILPPTPEKIENPVFDFAEGGTIEDLIRMLRS